MGSNTEQIVSFLHEYRDQAWTTTEIANRTDIDPDTATACLSRLEEQALVHRTDLLWTITNDTDRLRRAYYLHRTTEHLNERYGEEDPNEWITDDTEV